MAKHNRNNDSLEGNAPETTITETAQTPVNNYTLTFRRTHPKERASYGVDGNSGIVVFDRNLMEGGDAADFTWPATITLDAVLVKVSEKVDKATVSAAKAAERETKAKAKLEAAQAKVAEREAKAKAKLEAAQAKLAAAQAAAAATSSN